MKHIVGMIRTIVKAACEHCGGTGWIGDIACPACS